MLRHFAMPAALAAALVCLPASAQDAPAAEAPAAAPSAADAAVRQYVIDSYLPLADNITAGEGPFLKTLLLMAHVPRQNIQQALVQLRSLHDRKPYIIDFADGVVAALKPVAMTVADDAPPAPARSGIITAPLYDNAAAIVAAPQQARAPSAPPEELLEVTRDSPFYVQPSTRAATTGYAPAGSRIQVTQRTSNDEGVWALGSRMKRKGWVLLEPAAPQP